MGAVLVGFTDFGAKTLAPILLLGRSVLPIPGPGCAESL